MATQRQKWSLRWYTAYNDYFLNAKLRKEIPLSFLELLHYQNLMSCCSALSVPLTLYIPAPYPVDELLEELQEPYHGFINGQTHPSGDSVLVLTMPKGSHVFSIAPYASFPFRGSCYEWLIAPGKIECQSVRQNDGVTYLDCRYHPHHFPAIPYLPLTSDELVDLTDRMKYNLGYLCQSYGIPSLTIQSILDFFRRASPDIAVDDSILEKPIDRTWSLKRFREHGILFMK